MKNILVIILLSSTTLLVGQTKKVLFEEFTGTSCGQCPEGNYITDSLLGVYPDVIGISLHTYHFSDSMFFQEIDTIYQEFGNGAPTASTDRVLVKKISFTWASDMQTRLAVTPEVSVALNATWSNTTREISTNISCDILQNLPTGDYRFNLYVVEDSVTGVGNGYDQSNIYNTFPGSPFFGLGDPIVGYVHRHVARALLPEAWGQSGIIAATPTIGQTFSTTINYTLPATYDENKIKLVGFVSKYTSNHLGDEVLNAEEIALNLTVGIDELPSSSVTIHPNPTTGKLTISLEKETATTITLRNGLGQLLLSKKHLPNKHVVIDIASYPKGIYFLQVEADGQVITKKVVKE